MRKKNAGALFMDFEISPDDRVGATPKKARGRGGRTPAKPGKPKRGGRDEPQMGGLDSVYAEDEPVPRERGNGRKPKAKRGRRQREPLTLGRIFLRLFYWLFVLGIWGGIAVAGVVVYFAVQLPASNTWAVPER